MNRGYFSRLLAFLLPLALMRFSVAPDDGGGGGGNPPAGGGNPPPKFRWSCTQNPLISTKK